MTTAAIPGHKYIAELAANEYVDGVYAIQNAQLGQTKAGKPFLKCLLADKTGRTPGRMWNIDEALFKTLPTDGFVWVAGQSQPYQGEVQIIVQQVRPHEPTDAELAELLPSTKHDVDQMFAEVTRLLDTLESPACQAIATMYLSDGELMQAFCQAPAAREIHHAYLGGLLEHTLGLMRLADAVCPLYPGISRDVVMLGLFLHDLGKTQEMTWQRGLGYSADGELVGHIARGVTMLQEKVNALKTDPDDPVAVPVELVRVLEHILLSHHGVPEYGALKVPATPEAILIHHLDNIDAKLNIALTEARDAEALSNKAPGDFSEKVWALGTRLYRPDPAKL
ncbi:MAG: HD domain-containing protein [Planctomycetota bacterium]